MQVQHYHPPHDDMACITHGLKLEHEHLFTKYKTQSHMYDCMHTLTHITILAMSVDTWLLLEIHFPYIDITTVDFPCLMATMITTLRPRQNGRNFPDKIFRCIFLNENVWISIKISLKFVPDSPINNIPALVQIMAWRRQGDKPFSEPMMVRLLMHICVTWPQWVNRRIHNS